MYVCICVTIENWQTKVTWESFLFPNERIYYYIAVFLFLPTTQPSSAVLLLDDAAAHIQFLLGRREQKEHIWCKPKCHHNFESNCNCILYLLEKMLLCAMMMRWLWVDTGWLGYIEKNIFYCTLSLSPLGGIVWQCNEI